jgi:hypothetical protein
MGDNGNLDTLDRVVLSAGGVAVLVGTVYFVIKIVIPLFEKLIASI